MVARLEDVGGLRPGHDGADRHARAEPLGQRHHVGLDARPLVREPLARASHAALHLVDHEQPFALVAQLPYLLQVFDAHRVDAAFALDGFEEDGHHVLVAFGCLFQGLHVVERHADEPFDQRAEALLHLFIARGGQCGDAAAVEGLFVHHDLRPLDAAVVPVFASQLDRRLVCFQAGAAEEGVGQARQLGERGRQPFLVGHVVVVAAVDDLADLVLQRGHELGVVVAERVHGDTGQRVEVFLAVDIPHSHALAVRQRDRQPAVGIHGVGRRSLDKRHCSVSRKEPKKRNRLNE